MLSDTNHVYQIQGMQETVNLSYFTTIRSFSFINVSQRTRKKAKREEKQ